MDPIIALLNAIIKKNLSKINQEIQNGIKQKNLDPMKHVTSGEEGLGHINLGICKAFAKAGYEIDDLSGLSSLNIISLEIVSGGSNPDNPSEVNGKVQLEANMGADIKAHVGGHVTAGCGFIHPKVGISGTVKATKVTAVTKGSFSATIKGSQACLEQITLSQLSINYGSASINIDGLGVFNTFLKPLEDFILSQFKGNIRSAVAAALTPVLNSEISKVLPLCDNIP